MINFYWLAHCRRAFHNRLKLNCLKWTRRSCSIVDWFWRKMVCVEYLQGRAYWINLLSFGYFIILFHFHHTMTLRCLEVVLHWHCPDMTYQYGRKRWSGLQNFALKRVLTFIANGIGCFNDGICNFVGHLNLWVGRPAEYDLFIWLISGLCPLDWFIPQIELTLLH